MPLNQYKSTTTKEYNPKKAERDRRDFLENRINELKDWRKNEVSNNVEGVSIESIWRKADRLYPPHEYANQNLRNWQSKVSQPLGYVKLQTALSLMIDQNPAIQLMPNSDQFEKKVKLFEGLYNLSWEAGDGKQELRKFLFNIGKYGWGCGRTYYRKDTRTIKELKNYDPESGETSYEEKVIKDFDDVYFENMNVYDVWIDPHNKPNNRLSTNDWCYRKVYDEAEFKQKFPVKKYPNAKYVRAGNNQKQNSDEHAVVFKGDKHEIELYFYENKIDDEFMIYDAGNRVLLLDSVLPYKHKKLSLVQGIWTLRSSESPFGIGLMEIIEPKQELLDRIVNMRMDQVMLMVHKMLIYGGSDDINAEDFETEPGKAFKVFDTNNFKFLEMPGPGQESYKEEEMIRDSLDEDTGITKTLSGTPIGKTAFEASINRESGLRRMKIPLDNLEYSLTEEAKLRIALIQQCYANPQDLVLLTDQKDIDVAMQEMAKMGDKWNQIYAEDKETKNIYKKQFRTVRLPLSKTPDGEVEFTGKEKSFEITPEDVRFEGDVKIIAMSTIPVSKALQQKQKLDLFNIVAKLPDTDINKAETQIVKIFDEDPDDWMKTQDELLKEQMLARGMQQNAQPQGIGGPQSVVPQGQVGAGINQLISNTNEAI